MYSDDEKDILGNIDESQDGVVSWDNIIDTDDDGIVSIKNNDIAPIVSEIETEVFTNDSDDSDMNLINELVKNADVDIDESSDVNEIDEDELKRILSDDTSSMSDISNYEQTGSEDNQKENLYNDNQNDDILPRKQEVKKQQSVSPVLIAVLFALLVVAVVYFVLNMRNSESEDIPAVLPPEQQSVSDKTTNSSQDVNNAENNIGNIPVINEDEASELKPDDAKNEEEKKEVVNVIPTGRVNPFMPISKYISNPENNGGSKVIVKTVTRTINDIDYDSVKIPKPPQHYGNMAETVDKLLTIKVSGIMYDKVKPSAIITYDNNDYFVLVGDRLNSFKVIQIGPSYVKLEYRKNIYKANIGDEFKIDDFYSNAKYKEGSRQYYSSEDEYKNTKQENGYISNTDIQIRSK